MPYSNAHNDKLIVFAYFIPTVIWFVITHNDFIAYNQKTIADCRRLGRIHLILISIPTVYLAYVVRVQALLKDYKTMSLGLLVLIFSLMHIVRTYYGLWQLQVFKQWLINSILKMESFGYRAQLPTKRSTDNNNEPAEENGIQRKERLDRHADLILVKENLIDGIRNSRGIPYDFHVLNKEQLAEICSCRTMLVGIAKCIFHSAKNLLEIPALIYSLTFVDNPDYLYMSKTPFFLPQDPEKLWVRWACTLASQIPNWVEDVYRSGPMTDARRLEARRRARERSNAAMRGLSPWLLSFPQTRRLLQANPQLNRLSMALAQTLSAERDVEAAEAASERRRSCEALDCIAHSRTPFKHWKRNPGYFRCMSCKQKLLQTVFRTGKGLPYGLPHVNARNWEGEDAPFGYDQFRLELGRAKGNLPMYVEEKILHLGIRELEWLAVFLCV